MFLLNTPVTEKLDNVNDLSRSNSNFAREIIMSRRCIEKIQKWLVVMGVKSDDLHRRHDSELLVTRKLSLEKEYEVFIWIEGNTLVFQSTVFKVASGRSVEKELTFNQLILLSNAHLNFVHFGLAQLENNDDWVIVASSTHLCSEITRETLLRTIKSFDSVYLNFVPLLERSVNELDLEFTGRIRRRIEGGIKKISDLLAGPTES
jgi:hypothetical protein